MGVKLGDELDLFRIVSNSKLLWTW